MAQLLSWDAIGERFYETGVDHGVLYVPDGSGAYITGFAWNGLVSVTESPTGAESNKQYADNIPYLDLFSAEEFGATLEAFTFPSQFNQFNGLGEPAGATGLVAGGQPRKTFGLSYRTKLGNDVEGDSYGYKIHLLYGLKASPSESNYQTQSDSPEPITFSWELSSTPAPLTGFAPTSVMVVNSVEADPTALAALETILYGDDVGPTQPALPTPDAVVAALTP